MLMAVMVIVLLLAVLQLAEQVVQGLVFRLVLVQLGEIQSAQREESAMWTEVRHRLASGGSIGPQRRRA
jgi:hypothetical protein